MSPTIQILTIVCAVGAATAAGTFFTFSTFTIAGLRRLDPARGAAAMQAINEEAPTPSFMVLLFGTGLACLVLAIHAATHLADPATKLDGEELERLRSLIREADRRPAGKSSRGKRGDG